MKRSVFSFVLERVIWITNGTFTVQVNRHHWIQCEFARKLTYSLFFRVCFFVHSVGLCVLLPYIALRDNRIELVRASSQELTIRIGDVSLSDEGQYTCSLFTMPVKTTKAFLTVLGEHVCFGPVSTGQLHAANSSRFDSTIICTFLIIVCSYSLPRTCPTL